LPWYRMPSPEPMGELMEAGQAPAIRVLIADDYPMVRDIIRIACTARPGLEVVGEAADGIQALELCRELKPDVLVLDLTMPRMDGFQVIRRLRAEHNSPKILALTASDDGTEVFESLRLGVHGYLEKSAPVEEIADAVEAVATGAKVFSVEVERRALRSLGEHARRARDSMRTLSSLTARERQVLGLLAQGFSNRQIATRLGLSARTVETHIGNLYQKLDVRTRVQALYQAARLGLVDLDMTSEA